MTSYRRNCLMIAAAALSVTIFLVSQITCGAQVLLGVATSANLGETNPGALIGVETHSAHVDTRTTWSSAGKVATQEGWSLGGEALTPLPAHLLAGVDVRYRSGGAWHKQTAWGMIGASFGASRVLVALPVYESHTDHVTRLILRERVGRFEWAPQLVHYHQPSGSGSWGVAADIYLHLVR